MFDELKKEYDAKIASIKSVFIVYLGMPRSAIKVSLLDGRIMDATAWETTPMEIAKTLSKSLSDRVVIAKVIS